MTLYGLSLIGNGKLLSKGVQNRKLSISSVVSNPKTKIVALGGNYHSSVELYDKARGTWTDLPSMSAKRGSFACGSIGRRIYVAGGYDGSKFLNGVEFLDYIDGKKWVSLPHMSVSRGHVAGLILSDGVTFLVTGGYNGSILASCEKLNTLNNSWTATPDMAIGRYDHCACLYKGRPVVIGGQASSACEEYDPVSMKWLVFPPLIHTRYGHGGAVILDRQIFVVGGIVNGSPSASVEVYDGVKWNDLGSPLSAPRDACACVLWAEQLVVLGGNRDFIEAYDTAEKAWSVSTIVPLRSSKKRHYLGAISF